jgi:hypothetical protein
LSRSAYLKPRQVNLQTEARRCHLGVDSADLSEHGASMAGRLQPQRPLLNALDSQDGAQPRVGRKDRANASLVIGGDDQKRITRVDIISERAA